MSVFSDSGPLMALAKLGQLGLLFRLFGQVAIPTAVYRETVIQGRQYGHADAVLIESAIRQGRLAIVDVVQPDLPSDIAALPLDRGEKETLFLGRRTPNSLVLLDDLKARGEAKARAVAVKGTLGVLVQSHRAGLLDLEGFEFAIEGIIADDSIWIADDLCYGVLRRVKAVSSGT